MACFAFGTGRCMDEEARVGISEMYDAMDFTGVYEKEIRELQARASELEAQLAAKESQRHNQVEYLTAFAKGVADTHNATIARLHAENERLRSVLREVDDEKRSLGERANAIVEAANTVLKSPGALEMRALKDAIEAWESSCR